MNPYKIKKKKQLHTCNISWHRESIPIPNGKQGITRNNQIKTNPKSIRQPHSSNSATSAYVKPLLDGLYSFINSRKATPYT